MNMRFTAVAATRTPIQSCKGSSVCSSELHTIVWHDDHEVSMPGVPRAAVER
jgi:hypothetical protein